jgi:hypothetical protein
MGKMRKKFGKSGVKWEKKSLQNYHLLQKACRVHGGKIRGGEKRFSTRATILPSLLAFTLPNASKSMSSLLCTSCSAIIILF